MDISKIIKNIDYQKYLKKLKTKLKNKKILLIGNINDINYINDNYDLSGFDIKGILQIPNKNNNYTVFTSSEKFNTYKIEEIISPKNYSILIVGIDNFEIERYLYSKQITKYSFLVPIPINMKMQIAWKGGY